MKIFFNLDNVLATFSAKAHINVDENLWNSFTDKEKNNYINMMIHTKSVLIDDLESLIKTDISESKHSEPKIKTNDVI